jgi:histidinol dehydrogenase
MLKIVTEPIKSEWETLCKRPTLEIENCYNVVNDILLDVKQNGDAAIKKYTFQFDKVELNSFKIAENKIEESDIYIDKDLKAAIDVAYTNIYNFHLPQLKNETPIETTEGVTCWRKSIAISDVGLYIPGGTAPLFSTFLMLGIPAKITGCKNSIVCTPADKEGNVHPAILYIAKKLNFKNIFCIGGVQAIAAMAYGTESISKVNKIFGPGNQYVTAAKQIVSQQGVAIDMPAGPSEVLVYANQTSNPIFIAADLLSQAEHGIDSQVILVASEVDVVNKVNEELQKQISLLQRKNIAEQSLQNSKAIIIEDVNVAFDFINEYATEHLIIATDNADELSSKVINAGSIFLGHYSPESVGDYASGTNHTLPTNSYAKMYSGVSVDSFGKKITVQKLSKIGIKNIGKTVETMALAEGLQAHAAAVSVRLKQISNEF